MSDIDTDKINDLATMSLDDSRRNAILLLDEMSFKNQARKIRLVNDINQARRAGEVCRIMYFTYLAGEGLSVTGSEWQKRYN